MKNNQFLRAILIMVVTVVVFGVAAFGLNFITGPIIEKNNAGAALGALKEVMPEGQSFEDITATITIDASTGIKEVYKETTGKGFVFKGEKAGYSKTVYATVGVTADGKVCGLVFNENGDFPVSEDTINSFIGKDSALADIILTTNATTSSNTLKAIVEAGMNILISNNLITAGVKSEAQVLAEYIPTAHPGICSNGTVKGEEVAANGNIVSGYKGENGAGFAYIMSKAEKSYLAVTNNMGGCKIYAASIDEATGEATVTEVTSEHADLVAEALNHTNANKTSYDTAAIAKFNSLMGVDNATVISVSAVNSVVAAVELEVEGAKYYGFYSRSFGFETMDFYVVIDSEGKIAKIDAKTFIFEEEFFMTFAGMPNGYKEGFEGLTSETFDGSQAMIATATMTSNAMKQSTNDAFAAYEALKNGGSN
jgi:hypothetical protein